MLELILACAPNVAPHNIQELIRVESTGNPIAVNVNIKKNGDIFRHKKPRTKREAIAVTKAAIAAGHTVDMGYMQVNSFHLKPMNHSIEDMFDSCKNIKAGAHIFSTAYFDALKQHGHEQKALRAALSYYNTGSYTRGFHNGYVAKYTGYVPELKRKERVQDAGTTVFSRKADLTLETKIDWNRPWGWR